MIFKLFDMVGTSKTNAKTLVKLKQPLVKYIILPVDEAQDSEQ